VSDSMQALRSANPRGYAGYEESVAAARTLVQARIATTAGEPTPAGRRVARRRHVLPVSAGGALAAAAAAAAVVALAPSAHGPGVASAATAIRQAASLSAASAADSGTAQVRITRNGGLWAASTIRWHGTDLSVSRDDPSRHGRAGGQMLVVRGILYLRDPINGWDRLGSPASIDPGSGTTPADYLATVRDDVGGASLHRLTGAITGLSADRRADGSTVYRGKIAAGLIARTTGVKEGHPIRVFPFGYVAHDQAADPASLLDIAITVSADGVVRQVTVAWGTGGSAWNYTVDYSGLGATPAPAAPAHAKDLLKLRHMK
jgi:hypothetical protein